MHERSNTWFLLLMSFSMLYALSVSCKYIYDEEKLLNWELMYVFSPLPYLKFAHKVSLIEMHQRQQQQQPYHQSTVINGLQAQYYRQYPAEHLIWYPKLWCQPREVNCLTVKKTTTVQIKMIMEELVVFKVELTFNVIKFWLKVEIF